MDAAEPSGDVVRRVTDVVAPAVVRIGRHGGRGCGVVVDQGIVVTNAHNLQDRTTEVAFAGGRAVQARAAGVDGHGDLAVLEVDTGDAEPVRWAGEPPALGDPVVAVTRSPDGVRATTGRVSGVDRTFRGPRGHRITGAVEHTAPLARGSSGTPVVGPDGAVVGLSTLRLGDGFFVALPAGDELAGQIAELRAGRAPQHRLLGVALAPPHVARRMREAVGLPDRTGALVRAVEPGSPADRAGVRSGDLIVTAGGHEVTSVDAVARAVDQVPRGGSLALGLLRGSDEIEVVARPDDAPTGTDTTPDSGEA